MRFAPGALDLPLIPLAFLVGSLLPRGDPGKRSECPDLRRKPTALPLFSEGFLGSVRAWRSDVRMPGGGKVKHRAQTEDLVQDALSHFPLGHFRKSEISAIAGEERNHIRVGVEARTFGGDIVRHDQISILGNEPFPRILRYLFRFRRETDDNLLALVRCHFGENVSGRFERNGQRRIAFLDFLRAKLGGPVVRDGCRKDRNRSLGKTSPDSPTHFFGRTHVYTFHACGSFQNDGSADQNHFCAALRGGVGNRVAHLAGRAIGDVTNRVEVFASRTGGNEDCFPFQVPLRFSDFVNRGENVFQAGEAARPSHATGKVALIRFDDFHVARPQRSHIFLCGGVIPHVHIHSRSDHHRSGAGQIQGGEEIVRNATREFRNHICRCWGYQKKVRALRHGDVFNGAFKIGTLAGGVAEKVGNYFLSAQRGKGKGGYEFPSGARHYYADAVALLLQAAHKFGGLVRCDPAGDTQCDSHFCLPGRYFFRLLPSLSSSTEVVSGTSNSSKPCSNSSQATRVAFCVRGFSINGGAPAIICRARLAASTT